ncbi:MAG: type II toxin-antitoxin system VapC family toxin [Nitrospirae bacterium]|nr:type II toxin-antitoxin system VapC family toxin [Nitrospirota bacterium]
MSTEEYPFKALCDTSVYIPFINRGIIHPVFTGSARPVLYMSMVVLVELYAGSHDANSTKLVDRLYNTFLSVGRLIVPNDEDWRKAGMIMAKLGRKYGFEAKYISKIQNDILIACSARRNGAFVVTQNKKDFLRIKEFIDFRIYE